MIIQKKEQTSKLQYSQKDVTTATKTPLCTMTQKKPLCKQSGFTFSCRKKLRAEFTKLGSRASFTTYRRVLFDEAFFSSFVENGAVFAECS